MSGTIYTTPGDGVTIGELAVAISLYFGNETELATASRMRFFDNVPLMATFKAKTNIVLVGRLTEVDIERIENAKVKWP